MPAITAPLKPFDDADLARLDHLLWDHVAANGGMNLEAVDGFFSAMFVGPIEVLLEHLIALVWVEAPSDTLDTELVSEINQLLARYWTHVGKRISRDPESLGGEAVPPILLTEEVLQAMESDDLQSMESEHPFGADWASGFEYGTQFAEESWDARSLEDEALADGLAMISLLMEGTEDPDAEGDASEAEAESTESPDAEVEDDPSRAEDIEAFLQNVESLRDTADTAWEADQDMDDEALAFDEMLDAPLKLHERIEIISELPGILHLMHLRHMEELKPQTIRRESSDIGRNDLCPCGSGKKFKKCHGDPSRLH
ncbi:MAG: hypothetical protein BWZ07_00282 [Alphaproteobacteria bacterium ADurb.BinA280]|jgi:uncharacterized protein|nr:UPF0149 family protein [Xanthomonadales bacterium]MCC6506762.1 UPF0149 family protein [Aquimonas sp.]OPZ13770.1 MAG: hypothetical protein BWZ07_00282 [Alphaproteobacteria bacterium ADurb.BinA280]